MDNHEEFVSPIGNHFGCCYHCTPLHSHLWHCSIVCVHYLLVVVTTVSSTGLVQSARRSSNADESASRFHVLEEKLKQVCHVSRYVSKC